MIKARILAYFLLSTLAATQPVYAFDRDPWDSVGFPSGTFFASAMMREAAFVDVVLAEQRRPFLAGPIPMELASFRTLRRLKGGSPDVFTLLAPAAGTLPLLDRADEFAMYVDESGRVYPIAARHEPEVPFSGPRSSCDPGEITPQPGQLYVVFRGADGGLLRSARYHGDQRHPALPFRMTEPEKIDDWSIAVEGAAARWRYNQQTMITQPMTPRSDVARLILRRPIDASKVFRLLGVNGPRPFAVRVVANGGYADESRVPFAYAGVGLIDRALAGARTALAGWGGPALAQRLVAAVPEGDPGFSAFSPGIDLLAADRRLRTAKSGAAPGVISLELTGTAEQWRRLRASPLVASVMIGFTFQGQPAVQPLPLPLGASGQKGYNEKPADVIVALRALAARAVR